MNTLIVNLSKLYKYFHVSNIKKEKGEINNFY